MWHTNTAGIAGKACTAGTHHLKVGVAVVARPPPVVHTVVRLRSLQLLAVHCWGRGQGEPASLACLCCLGGCIAAGNITRVSRKTCWLQETAQSICWPSCHTNQLCCAAPPPLTCSSRRQHPLDLVHTKVKRALLAVIVCHLVPSGGAVKGNHLRRAALRGGQEGLGRWSSCKVGCVVAQHAARDMLCWCK